MGNKKQNKIKTPSSKDTKKLSAQKRTELNGLIDSLLQITFKKTINISEQWTQFVEIQGILERIQLIENTIRIKNPYKNRIANIKSFIKWIEKNGVRHEGIEIAEFSGYEFGLKAQKDIKKMDLLISVPRKLMMCEKLLSESLSFIIKEIPMLESMPNVKLTFGLLLQKLDTNSFWKHYINVLPEKYPTVLYWSINDMQEMKGSNTFGQALNQCKSIARQYSFIYKCLQNVSNDKILRGSIEYDIFEILKEKFSYDLYRWAVSTVMTRQNAIPKSNMIENNEAGSNPSFKEENSKDIIYALIPLWDMANHKEGVLTTSFNVEENQLENFALHDFAKDEQVFNYYGERSNADLLVHNGFVYPPNKKDSVSIKLGLSDSDELFNERNKILEFLEIPKNCELKIFPSPEFISPQLLAFVRIFNMNREQLAHWSSSSRAVDLLHNDCALETSLETKTWVFLQTRLTLLLRVFPTTLEEDEEALVSHQKGQTKLGYIRAMILQYRILEKKILSNALEYARQRTKT